MPRLFLLFILICTCIIASSQKKKTRFDSESFDASKFKPLPVEIKTKGDPLLDAHFSSVIVRDFRADKSKLGFCRAGEKIEDCRFVFPSDDEQYLNKKINKLFSRDAKSADTIVLVLKNLWLYQTQQQAGAVKRELTGEIQLISHCFIHCDVYSSNSGMTTSLGIIDTILTSNGWIVNKGDNLLKDALVSSLSMCDSMLQANQSLAHTDVTKPDLNLPVLSAEHPKKGVYLSFKDFVNNNPDTSSFQTEVNGRKRILKSSAYHDSIISKCWGYSDGEFIFMNINNDYYRLNRSQNTFDLKGPYTVDIKNTVFSKIFRTAVSYSLVDAPFVDVSELAKPAHQTFEFLKYYQLDIYTGWLK